MTTDVLQKYSKDSLTWELENFSKLTTMNRIDSPLYYLNEDDPIKFELELYPNGMEGHRKGTHTFINLWIRNGTKLQLSANYQISLIDANGRKCLTQDGNCIFSEFQPDSAETLKYSMVFNWQYQIARKHLMNPENGLLVNDKLKIFCEIEMFKEAKNEFDQSPFNNMSDNFASLLHSEKHSDVVLHITDPQNGNGKKFQAHKLVLCARSPVFSAMFEHRNTKEAQENLVEITDISVEAFEAFLLYVYTGKVEHLDQHALDLLAVANKYQVDSLKNLCEQYLSEKVDAESVSNYLATADMLNALALKKGCIEYITENAIKVMATEGWKAICTKLDLVMPLFERLAAKYEDCKAVKK